MKLEQFLKEEEVKEIVAKLKETEDSGKVFSALGGRYSYAQIRMVQADRGRS